MEISQNSTQDGQSKDGGIILKFSQMEYKRPDLAALKEQIQALTAQLQAAESYEAAKAVFLKKEELEKHISTQSTLAEIRHTIDTRDEFYDGEVRFWNGAQPLAGGGSAAVDDGDAEFPLPEGLYRRIWRPDVCQCRDCTQDLLSGDYGRHSAGKRPDPGI